MSLAACTPDREGEMGRVDPATPPPDGVTVTVDAAERERQYRDALAACADVEPALSREQCEAEARRAYEGRPDDRRTSASCEPVRLTDGMPAWERWQFARP
ncbi:hypothetical protein [Alkalisalibacterium limincola]|uniref:Uncharacterized protein n=1 Tax=Alkalisalibacterium limincola TaxID=2699169 RepID=A0A5C8L0F3_9GAMM|nr:hypothetical protein [Alkalisalibacterium limincola]TXK65725.1 hypothetical protein FU658_00980 [Alkalisalibacterium limincola]